MNPDYKSRKVCEWLKDMFEGTIALTDFQRSRVWEPARTATFLKAVLLNQPTGTVLLVETGSGFVGRQILDNDADISDAKSLILDGQQRLTSLWQSLMARGDTLYYINVRSLIDFDFRIMDVKHRPRERGYESYREECEENLIPVRLLYDPPDHDSSNPTHLEEWCDGVIPGDSQRSSQLRRYINQRFKVPLARYKLWHARFEQIGVDEAVTIFIETNSSSVRVTPFDLAVARAVQLDSDFKLRARIRRLYGVHSGVQYYFSDDDQRWISQIGDYLLKIACLKVGSSGMPPKHSNYKHAVRYLFGDMTKNADRVEGDFISSLQFLEENGVPNLDVLPRVPPVYVIAALQEQLQTISQGDKAKAIRLVTEYLWRSFLSDRYENQANDRLYADYQCLLRDIQRIKAGEVPKKDAPVFGSDHELSEDGLKAANKSRSPVGNALIALSLRGDGAVDWVTGERMTPERVRKLVRDRKIDRHHVFTRRSLIRGGLSKDDERINHPFNIVLIQKLSNIALGSKEPVEYLEKLKQVDPQLTVRELKDRIESHLLSYDQVTRKSGLIEARYEQYLGSRAKLLWGEVQRLIR